MTLTLYNSLTRKKEVFEPLDPNHVRMYVCGPTVYDRPHIGNARAVVVYDVLYRLLKQLYPKVTYARNITDVDDKINAAAQENGEPISELTARVTGWFHDDMAALGNLPPDVEPRATEEMQAIIELIGKIIANNHAYESEGHVLFDVNSVPCHPEQSEGSHVAGDASPSAQHDSYYYGKLSGKKLEDLIAGARVDVERYKRNSGDFVLWKPANEGDDPSSVFDSPWGKGRPGWHIECSAMSTKYLGENFDIHGGGADLKFPHHENEIAQSCCGNEGSAFATTWVHNGFVTVNGEKMAKSAGNFTTVKDLLDKGVKGEVIRYALLSSKYNEPLDWTERRLEEAKKQLDKWYRLVTPAQGGVQPAGQMDSGLRQNDMLEALYDDMNIPKLFSLMHDATGEELLAVGKLLGLLQENPDTWFKGESDDTEIDTLVESRNEAKKEKNWELADRIRDELAAQGIILEDGPDGTTWRKA